MNDIFQVIYVLKVIHQVGKKQCSNSGRKRNDIDHLESDIIVQPPSRLEFPGPLIPPPPWNFQFPLWWESGYFLEPHNPKKELGLKMQLNVFYNEYNISASPQTLNSKQKHIQ